jgi:hypothetical protein
MSKGNSVWKESLLEHLMMRITNEPKIKAAQLSKDPILKKAGLTTKQIRSRMSLQDIKCLRGKDLEDEIDEEDTVDSRIKDFQSITTGSNGQMGTPLGKSMQSPLLPPGSHLARPQPFSIFNLPPIGISPPGQSSVTGIQSQKIQEDLQLSLDNSHKRKFETLQQDSKEETLFWVVKDENSDTFFFPRRDAESIHFTVDKGLKRLYLKSYIKNPVLIQYISSLEGLKLAPIDKFNVAKLLPLEYSSYVSLPDGLDYKFQAFKLDGCFICRFSMDNTRFEEVTIE